MRSKGPLSVAIITRGFCCGSRNVSLGEPSVTRPSTARDAAPSENMSEGRPSAPTPSTVTTRPFASMNPSEGRPSALLPSEATASLFELRTRRVPAKMVLVVSRTPWASPRSTAPRMRAPTIQPAKSTVLAFHAIEPRHQPIDSELRFDSHVNLLVSPQYAAAARDHQGSGSFQNGPMRASVGALR
jgi:hypothetical protein